MASPDEQPPVDPTRREQSIDSQTTESSRNAAPSRRRLNLLFPAVAFLSFTFIMSAVIVTGPISSDIDGPFVRLMKTHGLTIMIAQVIAIFATGIGAMWLESRALASDSQPASKPDDSARE